MKISITAILVVMILAGCKPAPKDYVSGYDFTTARLVDLPWEMGGTLIGTPSSFEYDEYVKTNHPNWNFVQHALGGQDLFFLDMSIYGDAPETIVAKYSNIDQETCRLTDGKLMHMLCISNGVVTLEKEDDGFRLSVEVLEYQDYNEDGYMDVVILRMLPGSAAPRETLVLSRKGPAGPFYVVDRLDGAVRFHAGESHSWHKNEDGSTDSYVHLYVTSNMTVAELAEEYEVSEEVIREINGVGESGDLELGSTVVIPE